MSNPVSTSVRTFPVLNDRNATALQSNGTLFLRRLIANVTPIKRHPWRPLGQGALLD